MTEPAAAPRSLSDVTLRVLFDNVPFDGRLQCLWGFACLIDVPGRRLLFDTGSNGRVLLKNMHAVGVDPASVDDLFISHAHWDHTGGIDSLLELNPALRLIVPSSLSPRLRQDLNTLAREVVTVGESPQALGFGFSSTGTLAAKMPEQALFIETREGAVVVTGCAHPGIVTIATRATEQSGTNIALLAGGFHLYEEPPAAIDAIAHALLALGVRQIMPTHCTGDPGLVGLRAAFGERFITGGNGQSVRFNAHAGRAGWAEEGG